MMSFLDSIAFLTFGLGLLHFVIGGVWYSPLGFSEVWTRGLGLTRADIRESRINMRAALAASAIMSFCQVATIVWLVSLLAVPSAALGAGLGTALAVAFCLLPMVKDRVWADRPWSVIWVDAGYEITAGALVGLIAGWSLS